MVFREGDVRCVEELLKPARKVLRLGRSIVHEGYERRVALWNQIKESYNTYLDGECGPFLKDLDGHFCSQFEAALLYLATSFKENGEEFKPAERFSRKEMEVLKELDRYNVFEIYGVDDLKKKIVGRDSEVMGLLRDYYLFADRWFEEAIEDPSIKLPVRFYVKNKWQGYKDKLNQAVSSLIIEVDWFRKLVSEWQREAERYADKRVEEIRRRLAEEAEREIATKREELRREFEEIKRIKVDIERERGEIEAKKRELQAVEDIIRREREKLREIRVKIERGSRFVEMGRAKQYEMNFIGRIERKLGDEVKLFSKSFKVEEVKERKEVDTSRFTGMKSGSGVLTERDVKSLPENRCLEAKLVEKRLLRGKRKYVLRAVFASRVKRFAEMGFDVDPLELEDVNVYMVEARDEVRGEMRQRGEVMVLCIASPTGFDSDVREHICSDEFHRNFLSRYLSVILVDLETGKLICNPHDEVAKEFARICEMEIDEEKKARVRRCVEAKMEGREWLALSDVMECGDEAVTRAVFYEVAEEKGWRVRYVDGVGLVAMR
ncbi:hypothetical protein [Archaeoglobus sp.]